MALKKSQLYSSLWSSCDELRGGMDASQYKDVILGLVFLKYVSDAFDERRQAIGHDLAEEGYTEDQVADLIDDSDEYTGSGVFWINPRARWSYLAENAKGTQPAIDQHSVAANYFRPVGLGC